MQIVLNVDDKVYESIAEELAQITGQLSGLIRSSLTPANVFARAAEVGLQVALNEMRGLVPNEKQPTMPVMPAPDKLKNLLIEKIGQVQHLRLDKPEPKPEPEPKPKQEAETKVDDD
jgi:hypothetical protein